MNSFEKYHEAVAFIESFSNISIRKNTDRNKKDPSFFLERTRYFLKLIGDPGKDIRYIHVTGTAGKGTVSTMTQNMLVASGKRTGLFTSPYVTTTIEKIRVDDLYIAPAELVGLVEYLKPFIRKAEKGLYGAPSAFELFLAIALLYFEKQKCEWVVLEVGLGGRYDATNIIGHPIVTAITNVDYDHTEILGDTLREIATDKAGIIKPGSAFYTSEQRPAIQQIFKRICKEEKASFTAIPRQTDYSSYNRELVRAIGLHLKISEQSIEKGIQNTSLPCRFEVMQIKPLVILDGAHNRAKIRSTISNLKKLQFRKLWLIIAIADNKHDNRRILDDLLELPYETHLILTRVSKGERRSLHPTVLLPEVKKHAKKNISYEIIEDMRKALDQTLESAALNDLILVTGSFFLAGELRKKWVPEETVLKKRKMS